MKKFLLAAALMAGMIPAANAQKNYVVNGDFEATEGLEQSSPWDWDEDSKIIKNLPGWDVSLDAWCVLASIVEPEVDDEFVFEGNKQCLHMYRFDDNGWTKGTVSQIVKGLTVGEEYTLGAIIALSKGTTVDWDDPYFEIALMPLDENCEEFGAENVIQDRDEALAESDIWGEYKHNFKATTENYRLSITHNNTKWDGNHSEGFWMDVDDVVIMTPEDYEAYFESKAELSGIEEVGVENAEVLGVYNLNGVRVADSVEALGDCEGIYIVRTSAGAYKVIL